jgi:phospholipid/cholesterol/gamma-HCH transport system substrate-binding protein
VTDVRDRLSGGLSRKRMRLELRRAVRPFFIWIGLLVLGLIGIGGLLSRLQVAWPWKDQYRIGVAVDDAKGVVPGNTEVRLAGVVVGKVDKVVLGPAGSPVLKVRIKGKYKPLYRDARLRLRPKTPLEDVYLDVEKRGTPASGKVPDGGTLAAGQTQTPVYIGRVLDVFDSDVRVREKQAIDNLGRGLGTHGADFRAALVELAPFLDAARRLSRENAIRVVQTRRLIHNFRLMTEELGSRDRQVTRLVVAGSQALGELGTVDQSLSAFIEQMPPMLRQLPVSFGTLRAASDQLDPAFDALRPVAAALPAGLSSLERLGPDLSAGAAALRRPMPRLRQLVRASGPLAHDLGQAFSHLRPAAPRLDRITAQIVPCELAVQKFFQWSLSVTKFYDVHGAFPRGQDIAGANTAGGQVRDPELRAYPGCAKGGPRK